MTKLIILRGYPGSGKTTIGKQLVEQGVGKFVDHNAILTFIASIARDDDGIYDDIANLELAIARKLLKEDRDVIVARGFSGLESMKPYENLAAELNAQSFIIRLEVDDDLLLQRVSSKERLDDFNPTVTQGVLHDWIDGNPLIDHPKEKIIDNSKPLVEVVQRIISTL